MFHFLGQPLNLGEVSILVFHKQASKAVLVLEMKCFHPMVGSSLCFLEPVL